MKTENNAQSPLTLKEIMQYIQSGETKKELTALRAADKMLDDEKNKSKFNSIINKMIAQGMVSSCVEYLVAFDRPTLQREAASVLSCIAMYGESDQWKVVIEANAIPRMIDLLSYPSRKLTLSITTALIRIACVDPEARDTVLEYEIVEAIISILRNANTSISRQIHLIELIEALCWDCEATPPPFECIEPLIPVLTELLDHESRQVVIDACMALSKITERKHLDAIKVASVVAAGAVPKLLRVLGSDASASTREQAVECVGNLVDWWSTRQT
ncbi:importin subunit alpha-like [Anopheles aquasalis]|uniref:importin subunit alpha-like n=1 Tax=Anopheles aquasalis TaxID=42839 RepID=UPI00215B4726|nr:importin subunit alpha-like [Anopheles aquasalis]